MTFLTRAHEFGKADLPQQLAIDQQILKAVKAVDRMFDEEERSIYETRMQSMADIESKMASAEEKGMKMGLEKGMEKGIKQEKLNIAKNLLKILDVETVALQTKLSIDDVKNLKS